MLFAAQVSKPTLFSVTISCIKLVTRGLRLPEALTFYHWALAPLRSMARRVGKESKEIPWPNLHISCNILPSDYITWADTFKGVLRKVEVNIFVIIVQDIPAVALIPIYHGGHVLKKALSLRGVCVQVHERPHRESPDPLDDAINFYRFYWLFCGGLQADPPILATCCVLTSATGSSMLAGNNFAKST